MKTPWRTTFRRIRPCLFEEILEIFEQFLTSVLGRELIFARFLVKDNFQIHHVVSHLLFFASPILRVTISSLPRSSITFTAISWWPFGSKGALTVPARWSQTVAS